MYATESATETRATAAIEEIRHSLRDVAWGSYADISERRVFHYRWVKDMRRVVRPMFGHVILGNTGFPHRFYDRRPGEKPIYHYQHLPEKRRGNDFRGVLTGLANIQVPTHDGKFPRRFCLQVAPLGKHVDDEWASVYREKGLEAFLEHAYGSAAHAGRTAMIMIDLLEPGFVHFPQTPEDSQPFFRDARLV